MDSKILDVVSTVSVEKDVDKNIIFEALEEALSSATKKLVGEDSLIAVKINQSTGEYETFRLWEITDDEDLDSSFQIGKGDLDGYVVEEGFAKKIIENIDFGRISAQAAKQVIIQKVREAERSKITSKYEGLVGKVISGLVKRINRDFLLLELEEDLNAQIPRDQIIPGEIFKLNDRVRACLLYTSPSPRDAQLSRMPSSA